MRVGPAVFGVMLAGGAALAIWLYRAEATASVARRQAADSETEAQREENKLTLAPMRSYCRCVNAPSGYGDPNATPCHKRKGAAAKEACRKRCRDVMGTKPEAYAALVRDFGSCDALPQE